MLQKGIVINNLSFAYPGQKTILENISLRIQPNERLAILGANASGKSTLLRIISGQLPSYEGEVSINGISANTQNILTCTQNASYSLFDDISILKNFFIWEQQSSRVIRQGVKSHYAQSIEAYLKTFHPALKLQTEPSCLSGGQKQLLLLALILRSHPPVLLLDEHTSALDPIAAEKVLLKIQEKAAEFNIPTVFVTHNISDIKHTTRYIVIKNKSVIIDEPSGKTLSPSTIQQIYTHTS